LRPRRSAPHRFASSWPDAQPIGESCGPAGVDDRTSRPPGAALGPVALIAALAPSPPPCSPCACEASLTSLRKPCACSDISAAGTRSECMHPPCPVPIDAHDKRRSFVPHPPLPCSVSGSKALLLQTVGWGKTGAVLALHRLSTWEQRRSFQQRAVINKPPFAHSDRFRDTRAQGNDLGDLLPARPEGRSSMARTRLGLPSKTGKLTTRLSRRRAWSGNKNRPLGRERLRTNLSIGEGREKN